MRHNRLADNVRLVDGLREWAIYKLDDHEIIRLTPKDGLRIKHGILGETATRQLLDARIFTDAEEYTKHRSQTQVATIPFRSAWLELTNACNLSCSHCYMEAGQQKFETDVDWAAVIEYLAKNNCHQVIFIGGEPICHPHFLKYVELAKHLSPSMRLCVVTNGTLWTERLLGRMKDWDVFIKFSLLGSDANRHDAVTGVPGSFDAVMRNIDYAISLGIRLEISTTLVPASHETVDSMSKFITSRFGDVKHSITRVRPQGRQLSCGLKTSVCDPEKLAVNVSQAFFDNATHQHPCLHGKVAFSYSGLAHPCIMARYESQDINDVLKHPPEEVFHSWWTLTKDKIEGCKNCALRYACFDCRGFATSISGSPCNCRLAQELTAQEH